MSTTLEKFLDSLGYQGSPFFLRRGDARFESEPGYGHIFRSGCDRTSIPNPRWQVEGVYGVRDWGSNLERFVPIVYVCDAKDELTAQDLHRLVWNQDVVPYILVHTPRGVRVYSGFRFSAKAGTDEKRGVLSALTGFNNAQSIVDLFHAREVDEGRLWQHPHLKVDSSQRVYHRLLASLRKIDDWLRDDGLSKDVSHALIGKFVYLRYLHDRGILSYERLDHWGLKKEDIFGRKAKKTSLEKLNDELDRWLNGEVFPLPWRGEHSPKAEHIHAVAAAFNGDEFDKDGTQLHLGFQAYDFSYIPIETLSLVYEQFLHLEDRKPANTVEKVAGPVPTKGRSEGAYYTPLPLVNYMLSEMESQRPLERGMKVFDPSCGSGAFLVQAYRRLIEKTFPISKQRPKPSELRELLKTSIFGCDVDGDACQVTQLSLLLTLLDYVEPPDLLRYPTFQLPTLGKATDATKKQDEHFPNILEGNFFEIESSLCASINSQKFSDFNWRIHGFDWVVGNPPWKGINPKQLSANDSPVWEWMKANAQTRPVGLNQAAQAFAWESACYLKSDGECGQLIPGMGLFEEPSANFRANFFRAHQVHMVANFANLAEVLFDGRSRVPAAALFYRLRPDNKLPDADEPITTFSPFVVNQEATCPLEEGQRSKIWSLVVNSSEVCTLEHSQVASGSNFPWKLAMWGTPWDERLIKRLERKWRSLEELEAKWNSKRQEFVASAPEHILCVSEGLQLREHNSVEVEPANEVSGKWMVDMAALDRVRAAFTFPSGSLSKLEDKQYYALKGRVKRPLTVSRPPHIIVSEARTFAIFSDEFIVVPPRQIGVVSRSEDVDFLKALSLYFNSDFAFYHQLFRASHFGIKRPIATLAALRQLPIPLTSLSRSDLREWAALHAELVKCPSRRLDDEKPINSNQGELFKIADTKLDGLLRQLNKMTAQALGLDAREQALIRDLVQVRYALNDGKRGDAAMRKPGIEELHVYASALKQDLDDFVGPYAERRHRVTVVIDDRSAMVEIDFSTDHLAASKPVVIEADSNECHAFRKTREMLLRERAQWVYFNRNLRVYRGRQTYIFKPLNRFHWTESAGLIDASEVIAETLGSFT